MLNRRTFLKTRAVVIPMTAPASTHSAEEVAVAAVSGSTLQLVLLPPRMASIEPASGIVGDQWSGYAASSGIRPFTFTTFTPGLMSWASIRAIAPGKAITASLCISPKPRH
jgi:hypothetical protein